MTLDGPQVADRDGTEGGASGTPEVTVEPSGDVVGLNQQNVYEGGCPLENFSVSLPMVNNTLSTRWHIKDNSILSCVSSTSKADFTVDTNVSFCV